jgi:apolipoprotein N-acyltransferase
VRNGAQFISIITNDGWWGDTPGYKQHLKFGALRAIETRKWIARSANTGISCFIDPKGNVLQPAGWWVPAVISGEITLHDGETFYTRHGDYIAKAALCIAFALLIYSILVRFRIAKKW